MSRSEANCDEIITDWIIEYARSLMWQKFKACSSNPIPGDKFVQGVITKAQLSGCCNRESLLTEWMFLVCYGRCLYGNGLDIVTPLEKALNMLPHLKENFRSLKKKVLSQVELLLKEQAVLVCIKEREFNLAKTVKDRIWNDTTTQAEQEISSHLDLVIQSRSLSGYDAPSSFEDLIESVRELLEDLCENQLSCPYLIKRAVKEGKKKVDDEQDHMARNLAAATQTGIIMTGALLSAFIAKHKLQPEFGVGFVTQDMFESAVQSLRCHKDRLLKSIPDFLSVPFSAEIENASPAPVTTEKAVSSSSSLKRKLRERCSSSPQYRKRSSVSESEHHQKDSDSGSDINSDDDNAYEKAYDTSLRKRIAKSHKGPLFQEGHRFRCPKKLSSPQLKRKPRSKWTADEEKRVYKAVRQYGLSSWADIAKSNILPGRSNVDIKDKWRTMVKTGRVKEIKEELKLQLDSSSEEN